MGGSMSSIVIFGDTSGSITLDTPAVAGTNTITLPANTGTIITTASSINASSITSGSLPKQQLPTGSILQVIQSAKTNTFSTTSTSYVDITGISVSITPSSNTNKILVFYSMTTSQSNNFEENRFSLLRGSTEIFIGTTGSGDYTLVASNYNLTGSPMGVSQWNLNGHYLDSPATTNATTYKIQMRVSGGTGYINRAGHSSSAGTVSAITVMEVAA